MKMNKTIVISPHDIFPPKDGGERRIYLLLKEMLNDKEVELLSPIIENKEKMDLPITIHEVFENKAKKKLLNKDIIKKLSEIDKDKKSEIQLEYIWQGINLILSNRKYIVDAHNVEFLRFKRTSSKIWPIVFLYELLVFKLAKRIVCVSETDKEYISKYFRINKDKIEVKENPVDKDIFYPNLKNKEKIRESLNVSKDEKLILFFGQLNYKPNIGALNLIKEEIIPRLDKSGKKYKLVVCGRGDGKGVLKTFNHKNFIFLGFVDKIEDYINSSDVIIAPILSGSGTRIKILEALACNKKVVSTSIGAEGIKSNSLLKIEDEWDEFVKEI